MSLGIWTGGLTGHGTHSAGEAIGQADASVVGTVCVRLTRAPGELRGTSIGCSRVVGSWVGVAISRALTANGANESDEQK